MSITIMRGWPASFAPFLLLTLILSLSHVEVQASHEISHSLLVLRPNLAINGSTPNSSKTLDRPLAFAQDDGEAVSATALTPASSANAAAKQGVTTATNDTNTGSGTTGALADLVNCDMYGKRSPVFKDRHATHLHKRKCVAPDALEPATGLVPNSDAPSEAESIPQPASSADPQAGEDNPQKDSQQINSQQHTESQQTKNPQTDSQQADSQQANDQQKDSQQSETQPAQAAPHVNSEPAAPVVVLASVNAPIIVQDQTLPANGDSIIVNNQPVKVVSGYIHVGTLSAPIPEAQVKSPHAEPIVAGTFTFRPASPSPASQVVPFPFVVGGLTFSAKQSEPSSESNEVHDQPQVRPVVVDGKMYAPVIPISSSGQSQAAGNMPEQENSESSSSQRHSSNAASNDFSEPGIPEPQGGKADFEPVVIGGMTYTPITAEPTPAPQHAAVFSFDGVALTQDGNAVTISGTRFSLGPSAVFIGTSSLSFSTASTTKSFLEIGSETLTALHGSEGGFEVDHSTLLPGSSAVIISGKMYSINKSGSLIIGTSTVPLAADDSSNMSDSALTAGGESFTPVGSTAVVVDGTTISIGGPAITKNGTRLSLALNRLLVGSSTFAYATPAANTVTISSASGPFSTSALSGVGAAPMTYPIATPFPSATGRVERSAASVKMLTPTIVMALFVVSLSVSMIIGIF